MANFLTRTMTQHMLTPLRHMYQGSHLICNAAATPSEEALFEHGAIPAGRAMHLVAATGPGEVASAILGCSGNQKVPVFIFHESDQFSTGMPADIGLIDNGPNWAAGDEGQRILMFVGLEGFELATTEYDDGRTYLVGEYVRAPELSERGATAEQTFARDSAGKLTNDTVENGVETIIGMVSPGAETDDPDGLDPYGNNVISIYTMYRPPIQGLLNGTPTNVTRS